MILRPCMCRYELHHGVRISDSALIDAAVLSSRYIADRFLPDKCVPATLECPGFRVRGFLAGVGSHMSLIYRGLPRHRLGSCLEDVTSLETISPNPALSPET